MALIDANGKQNSSAMHLFQTNFVNLQVEGFRFLVSDQDTDFIDRFSRKVGHIQVPAPEAGEHVFHGNFNGLPFPRCFEPGDVGMVIAPFRFEPELVLFSIALQAYDEFFSPLNRNGI